MILTKTMVKIRMQFEGMKKCAQKSYSPDAKEDLLLVISIAAKDLDDIDHLIIEGRCNDVLDKIAEAVFPRKKDFFFRRNYDHGEAWPRILDEFREGKIENVVDMAKKLRRWPEKSSKKTKKSKKKAETLFHLDSYCESEKNKDYWKQMEIEDGEYSQAVKDFLEYVEEVKC